MDRLNINKLNRRRVPGFNNLGPWIINAFEPTWDSDYNNLTNDLQNKVNLILKDLVRHPYQGKYGQHPLWQFTDNSDEYVIWSAVIDRSNRLTYLIHKDKNEIYVINCYGHQVGQYSYSNPGE